MIADKKCCENCVFCVLGRADSDGTAEYHCSYCTFDDEADAKCAIFSKK